MKKNLLLFLSIFILFSLFTRGCGDNTTIDTTLTENDIGIATTKIEYTLNSNSPVTIQILDISGQEIKTLVNETHQKGEHNVVFDGTELKAGIYFCVLKTNEGIQTRKIIKL